MPTRSLSSSNRSQDPQVSARIGALILRFAASRGVDDASLMREVGFSPAWLSDVDARMPLAMEESLWELAADRTDDPAFGLHAAQSIRPGAFDVLDYAVRTAPTLRDALHRLARYNRLLHDLASFLLVPADHALRVHHGFGDANRAPCRHASEFTLASLVVVASQMASEPIQPECVEFSHGAGASAEVYQALFGCLPRFGAETSSLTLGDDILDRPLPASDPGLSRIVTAHAEQLLAALAPTQAPVASKVKQLLLRGMAEGPPSLVAVAAMLHMSERSLQRRLDAEGTAFSDLVESARRDLALRYIADERLALGEVAYLLGFAEPSPFHRAFKRWTGTTPAAARRSRAQAATRT